MVDCMLARMQVVQMVFGSHMYGTATPTSDMDYKGIYLPSFEECLLQRVPKSISEHSKVGSAGKNQPEDYDKELYSLHYFLKLACQGETVALDMLHAPASCIQWSSHIWDSLVVNRQRFYTKNLKAFVGYARKQAAKYGVKGSRLAAVEGTIAQFNEIIPQTKLSEVWDSLVEDEHRHKWYKLEDKLYAPRYMEGYEPWCYEVCGKKMTLGSTVGHYLPMLQHYKDEYGARATLAKENKGVDWKAVSHAFRAAFQVLHIMQEGTYSYPLPETEFLLKVKKGKLNYADVVGPALDELITMVEEVAKGSKLPEEVDRKWWDGWLMNVLMQSYGVK